MAAPIKTREWIQNVIRIHLTKGKPEYVSGNVHHKINHNGIMEQSYRRLLDEYNPKKLTKNYKGEHNHHFRNLKLSGIIL